MSVEFWTAAEKFYETWLPIVGISLCVLSLIFLYTRFYASGKAKKNLTRLTLLATVLLFGFGAWGYKHYEAYLPKAKLVTPLIRDRKRGLLGYKYYGRSETDLYAGLHAPEKLKELGLYEEERVEHLVTYLGKGPYFHYFEDQNGRMFKITRGVVFEKQASDVQMIGETFHLNDLSFEEIGFFDPKRIMFDHLVIPANQEGKEFEPDFDPHVPKAQEYFSEWSF